MLATSPAGPPPDPAAQVFSWIVAGASQDDIRAAIEHFWPGTKPRPLIVAAMKRIAANGDVDRASLTGWCLEACRLVYQRALESGDHSTALRAVKQLHALAEDAAPPADPFNMESVMRKQLDRQV